MRIGVFGLSGSGKSTVYSLLTGVASEPGERRTEGASATALVHDARVDELAGLFNPKKVTRASLTFIDMPGFDLGATRAEKNRVMQFIQNSDAILAVVRAFDNEAVAWPAGADSPLGQLDAIRTELLLRDLAVVEGRLERIAEVERKRHKLEDEVVRERRIVERVKAGLESEQPVERQDLSPEELKIIGTLGLFTAKPIIVAVNTGEEQANGDWPGRAAVRAQCEANGLACIELSAWIETEISRLEPAERQTFLDAYGFAETGIERLSRVAYAHVGLISFLTVGEDEVRAWTVRRDTRAREAAGAIHTRLAQTFVRAEVISYETFMTVRCLKTAKARNLVRLAGADEVVNDGDIFHVRASG
jgi:GTP-binding protein YchF